MTANGVDHANGTEELFRDVISQFPILNAYTQVILGFKPPTNADRDEIVSSVQRAFDDLKEQIPILGWHVVQDSSGIRKAVPRPEDIPGERVRVKNCDDVVPAMAKLITAGVPMGMLDGQILLPWPALPAPRGLEGPDPVFAIQINFVRGGVLLNLSTHHTIIDGTGFYQLLSLLARTLGGGEITADEIEQANRDRSQLFPLIPRSEPVKDFSHLRRPPGWTWLVPKSPPTWAHLIITPAAMVRIIKSVREDPAMSKQVMISDNDIFSAWVWKRVCIVRLANGQPPDHMSKLGRAIDARMALGVPMTYMGHMVAHAVVRLPLSQVASLPLPQLALILRRELNQANTPWAIRSYATFIAREPDTSNLLYGGGKHDPRSDLMISATGNSAPIPSSWGALGKYCFHRRPTTTPMPGCLIVDEPALTLCLAEEDITGLKKDVIWKQHIKHVG